MHQGRCIWEKQRVIRKKSAKTKSSAVKIIAALKKDRGKTRAKIRGEKGKKKQKKNLHEAVDFTDVGIAGGLDSDGNGMLAG